MFNYPTWGTSWGTSWLDSWGVAASSTTGQDGSLYRIQFRVRRRMRR